MPSAAFLAFEESLLHTDPRVFVYDLDALARLPVWEVPAAHALLDTRIRAGDIRAIETALAAGYADLTPAVTSQLDAPHPAVREAVARALTRLTGASDMIARVIANLRSANTDMRINAAQELARTRTVAARLALREALSDAESIVRAHAWAGLLEQLDLAALKAVRHSPLGVLTVQLYTELPSVRLAAAAEASAILQQIEAGASPADLGLAGTGADDPPALAPFIASLDSDYPAIDVAAIFMLDAPHRAWANAIVAAALERRDARAITARLALDAHWAVPALLDAAAGADDLAFADQANAVALQLGAP